MMLMDIYVFTSAYRTLLRELGPHFSPRENYFIVMDC
jgi:hypothetical protein